MYYGLLTGTKKPFNRKLGLFTLFADKTTPERIMNKIYGSKGKEEETEEGTTFESRMEGSPSIQSSFKTTCPIKKRNTQMKDTPLSHRDLLYTTNE